MDDKVIVTNLSALRSKYGKGLPKIEAAIKRLVAADKKRGIATRFVALDDAATMKKLNAPPVTNAGDFKQNKQAIDGVYRALMPDYLMILGANDIVPHQNLKNPVFNQGGDEDQFAFGDIPYACEAPYSQKPQDFTGPTRVVGRLPDLNGVADVPYLIRLIEVAIGYKQLKPADYAGYLGITAEVWQGSTEMSLTNLFGSASDMQLVPDRGPKWDTSLISRRAHFINCHGAQADFHFYGQRGGSYPEAHDASFFNGKIKEGTVVAAECCYGGELYNPNLADGQAGICNTYLGNKAYGFFGSTTIAYGPADGQGSADIICQAFLRSVFKGASTGRAALEARQRFIESTPELDPVDLKTLAQFNLYGDPSITPVAVPSADARTTRGTTRGAKAFEAAAATRSDVRRQLLSKGLFLAKNHPVAAERITTSTTRGAKTRGGGGGAGGSVQAELKRLASSMNMRQTEVMSFGIDRAPEPKSMTRSMKAMRPASTAFHVMVGRTDDGGAAASTTTRGTRGAKAKVQTSGTPPPVAPIVALVAKEVDGKIVSVRELHGK
ncbi:MAG TPA: hypothetical protein VGC66_13490 [Pyrinomonadaceae bacterium]|jgi:hypothetical protein